MPLPKLSNPFVKKSKYYQKKQQIQQLKDQNQQLQDQISQLQTLQKENPTSARIQTIRTLSKKQGNIYSRLNGLGAEIDDIERERERATSPILPELSTEREISEQTQFSMPDKDELDSPTTVVGEEEYYTDSSEKDEAPRRIGLEHGIYNCEDYQKWVNGQFRIKTNAVLLAQSQLDEKDQTIFDLNFECGNLEAQLGFEQTRNQIIYDTLISVVLERDILAKKYAHAKGKIERRERGLRKLSEHLATEKELVDIKQRRINDLNDTVNYWKTKYYRERKSFINHDIQLAQEQRRIKKLRKNKKKLFQDYKELDNQYDKLEKQKNKVDTRLNEQVNNLKKLATSKKTIQEELKWAKDKIDHLEFKLETRTEKLKKARSRIKDLLAGQKELKTVAEKKNVSLALIKYTPFKFKKLEENSHLEKDVKNTCHSLIETVGDTQKHLGVKDLTQITTTHQMPEGKSLSDLVAFYEDNKDRTPATPGQTRIITNSEPSETNETIIVNTIIQECDLGLSENSSLTQVINRIKKLIEVKPPIIRPVSQSIDTPFGEDLEIIKNIDLVSLEQELNILLSPKVKEQIQKATNYQELSNIRNREIKSYLEKGQTGITTQPSREITKPIEKERIVWIGLLVISLLVIGGLVVRLRKKIGKKVSF